MTTNPSGTTTSGTAQNSATSTTPAFTGKTWVGTPWTARWRNHRLVVTASLPGGTRRYFPDVDPDDLYATLRAIDAGRPTNRTT